MMDLAASSRSPLEANIEPRLKITSSYVSSGRGSSANSEEGDDSGRGTDSDGAGSIEGALSSGRGTTLSSGAGLTLSSGVGTALSFGNGSVVSGRVGASVSTGGVDSFMAPSCSGIMGSCVATLPWSSGRSPAIPTGT